MIEFPDPVEQMAAVLHDVVEDTYREIRDQVNHGFPNDAATAINPTHRSNESYDHYIERLSTNDVAEHVKIIDLRLKPNRRLSDSSQATERIAGMRRLQLDSERCPDSEFVGSWRRPTLRGGSDSRY